MHSQSQTLMLTHNPNPMPFVDEMLPYMEQITYPECADFLHMPRHLEDTFIASGYFSSVWTIPGNPFQVLKVSHREGDACRHYMRWVFDQPSRHAPKIHSIDYHDELMLVVMDRYYRHRDWALFQNDRSKVWGNAVITGVRPPDPLDDFEVFCAKVRDNFTGYKFDLHRDNLMMDRNGYSILTDPVSFCSTHDERYEL